MRVSMCEFQIEMFFAGGCGGGLFPFDRGSGVWVGDDMMVVFVEAVGGIDSCVINGHILETHVRAIKLDAEFQISIKEVLEVEDGTVARWVGG